MKLTAEQIQQLITSVAILERYEAEVYEKYPEGIPELTSLADYVRRAGVDSGRKLKTNIHRLVEQTVESLIELSNTLKEQDAL